MSTTARLNLPYIAPLQAQKQVTYNEGMAALDQLVQPAVFRRTTAAPPGSPADGDAYIALQRQYYVSEGFNCEQAIAAFLPVQDGTVVVYANHTSTDQVAGFGGGAKRSIGSKMMSSQLEEIFGKLQKSAK